MDIRNPSQIRIELQNDTFFDVLPEEGHPYMTKLRMYDLFGYCVLAEVPRDNGEREPYKELLVFPTKEYANDYLQDKNYVVLKEWGKLK